jgi:hypothetical protein
VPTHVPANLHKEVIAIGGVPEDPDYLKRFEDHDEIVRKDPVMNSELRQKTIRDALLTMKERNLRGYFTAQGVPSLKQLEIICGFEVDKIERDRIWASIVNEDQNSDDAQAAA